MMRQVIDQTRILLKDVGEFLHGQAGQVLQKSAMVGTMCAGGFSHPKEDHQGQKGRSRSRTSRNRKGASSARNTRGETARKRAGRHGRVAEEIGTRQGTIREGRRLLRRSWKARSRRSGKATSDQLKPALQKASAAGRSMPPAVLYHPHKKGAGEPLVGALRRCGRWSSQNGQSASHSGSITTLMKLAARAMFASSKSSAIMPGTEWTIRSIRSWGRAL